MGVVKLSENIYSVGVKHPNLRVFDLLMPLPHGTTYNSYLITGEKNVLIDTVKLQFTDELIANIKTVIDPAKIDYIVIQHNELDHSGALPNILKAAPNAKVIIAKAAENFLVNSFNLKFEYIKVDDTTEIKIGPNQTLKFVMAPFLHWPDTMFTYYVEEKALFTCDAFGAHYSQDSGVFKDEIQKSEYDNYFEQFSIYFAIIMRVYSEKVLAAVKKIENLDINLIGPSHGPIVRQDIKGHIEYYRDFALKPVEGKELKKVTIVYSSMYGSTMKMAYHLESLLKNHGIQTYVAEIPFAMSAEYMANVIKEIASSDGVLFGASTVCSTILKPMWDFLFFLATVQLKGKTAGVFGSYGWDAQGLKLLEQTLVNYKMNVMKTNFKLKFVPSQDKLESCDEFIKEFTGLLAPKTANSVM